mmetsp:Transcript_7102/g.14268  ORF Transcript_7102/g.14268 Transcript_7102/m.14268 type:complete len:82 (+) Transcript_7102:244-489(+)
MILFFGIDKGHSEIPVKYIWLTKSRKGSLLMLALVQMREDDSTAFCVSARASSDAEFVVMQYAGRELDSGSRRQKREHHLC